jgi:Putative zinc-finger
MWVVLVAAPSFVAAAIIAIGLWYPTAVHDRIPPEPTYGGIACSRVVELAPEFVADRIDPETADRVRRHLELCPTCRAIVEGLRAAQARSHQTDAQRAHNNGPASDAVMSLAVAAETHLGD